MSESRLELDVKSAMRQGIISSETRASIKSNDSRTSEQLAALAVKINEVVTQRHSAYLVARSQGYILDYPKNLEISG